jgi:hypothetical protein
MMGRGGPSTASAVDPEACAADAEVGGEGSAFAVVLFSFGSFSFEQAKENEQM